MSKMADWLDETAEIIRRDGPHGMSRDYCEMISENLLKLADFLRESPSAQRATNHTEGEGK